MLQVIVSHYAMPMLRISLLLGALLLSSLPIPSSAAPSPVPLADGGLPMYAGGLTPGGGVRADYGPLMSDVLTGAIRKRFPCTTTYSPDDLAALLGAAKDQQILGTPEDEQIKLETIGDALGARVKVFGSFGRLGDTYWVNLKAVDTKTARTIENQMVTDQGDDEVLFDLVDEAVSKMNLKVCRPKWIGTITVTQKSEYVRQGPGTVPAMAIPTRNGNATELGFMISTDETKVTLSEELTSSSGNRLDAKLGRVLSSEVQTYKNATMQVDCSVMGSRGPGGYDWRGWRTEAGTTTEYSGSNSVDGPVNVQIDGNGHYKISWMAPEVRFKSTITEFGESKPTPCGAGVTRDPEVVGSSEAVSAASPMEVEGDVDPNNPNALSGSVTTPQSEHRGTDGSTSSASITKKWQLTATSKR